MWEAAGSSYYHTYWLTTFFGHVINSSTMPLQYTLMLPYDYSPWTARQWRWRPYNPSKHWGTSGPMTVSYACRLSSLPTPPITSNPICQARLINLVFNFWFVVLWWSVKYTVIFISMHDFCKYSSRFCLSSLCDGYTYMPSWHV